LKTNILVGLMFVTTFLLQFLAAGLFWQNAPYLIAAFFWFIFCVKNASNFKEKKYENNRKV
jgi:hypothetical protein